jgi:hypothetical protein
VVALQAIFEAWNRGTPNVAANLPRWNDSSPFPCFVDVPWKGVLRLQDVNPTITSNSNISTNIVVVVGL